MFTFSDTTLLILTQSAVSRFVSSPLLVLSKKAISWAGKGGGEAWVSQVLPPSRPPSAPPYLLEEGLEESVTETADDASASEAEAEAAYARAQGGKDA